MDNVVIYCIIFESNVVGREIKKSAFKCCVNKNIIPTI